MRTLVDLPFATLENATYRSCRNDDCRSVQLEIVEEDKSAETFMQLGSVRGPGHLIVSVLATDEPRQTELRVSWAFEQPPLTDRKSDNYEVSIEADGQELYTIRKVVTEYQVLQPNGPTCDPTCYVASYSE